MPRDGSGQYHAPPGTDGAPDTTIDSARYNLFIADLEQVLNSPAPIIGGGTGGGTADEALNNLSAEKKNQVVTNFDSMVWMSGSWTSTSGATNPPVAGHVFSGIVYVIDANNITVEARDQDGTVRPGALYIRQKKAGVWSGWVASGGTSSGAAVLVSDTPPAGAADNSIWWESDTGITYIRFNDGNSTQWVAIAGGTNIAGIGAIKVTRFTTSGTYTPDPKLISAVIEAIGGGGGGGGAGNTNTTWLFNGGGGGSGGYSRTVATAATIGVSQVVTIGAFGAGGTSTPANGSNGGDTSVGSLCIAKGGSGGKFGSGSQVGVGGAGGIAGTGDVTAAGSPGGPGLYSTNSSVLNMPSDNGGSSVFGGGALGVLGSSSAVAGAAAFNYGSGGSAASAVSVVATAAGGNGSSGIVIITEYCAQ